MYNQRWEERLGADHAIIQPYYNGVEPDHFPPVEAEPEVPTVSWPAGWTRSRTIETLLRAFAPWYATDSRARLRLFGGTPAGGQAYLDRCRRWPSSWASATAPPSRTGWTNIRDALRGRPCRVLSSISEGFPYTVIEAMDLWSPLRGTDVAAWRRRWARPVWWCRA